MKQKIAELINVIFGMRKFILMVVLYVVGIVFRVKDLLSGAEMVDLFKSTTIAFMGANGVEHVITGITSVLAGKKSPAIPADANIAPVDAEGDNTAEEQAANGSK